MRPSPHSVLLVVAVVAFMAGGILSVYAYTLGGAQPWVVLSGAVVAVLAWVSLWWLVAVRESDG